MVEKIEYSEPLVSKEEAEDIYNQAVKPISSVEKVSTKRTLYSVRLDAVQRLANLTELAVQGLEEVLEDEETNASAKIKAAQTILSYAIGRPHEARLLDDTSYQGNNAQKIIDIVKDEDAIESAIDDTFYGGD